MKKRATAVLALVALLGTSGEVAASDPVTMSLDTTLVDADAIVLATVESISQAEDGVADVALKPIRTIENRWATSSALGKIRVRGAVSSDNGAAMVRFNTDRPALRRGRSYVFLLRGGASDDGPFVNAPIALMPVSESGDSIECGSGSVYGVTRHMVVCGQPETSYGPPMKVAEVCDALAKQLLRSKQVRAKRFQRRISELKAMTLISKVKGAP